MTPASGDRFTISVGGDASGPVVAGHDNHVEVGRPPADVPPGSSPDREEQAPGHTQTNTANDHGSVFTVMNGEMHIHQDDNSRTPREE